MHILIKVIKYLSYGLWLIKEIFTSSCKVTKIIWKKSPSVTSKLISLDIESLSECQIVMYANSITLTPGTVAVEIENGKLITHILDNNMFLEDDNIIFNKIKLL